MTADTSNAISVNGTEVNMGSKGVNERIILTTYGGADPTTGSGTMLAKIWYRTKTYGTEL